MNQQARRTFLGQAVLATPAVVLLGHAVAEADTESSHARRVVPGRPGAAFSKAVIVDRLVHVSGMLGRKPGSRDLASVFESQCRQSLENLKEAVVAAGSSLTNVLKCTCFLTDRADFSTFNRIFKEFFPTNPPARSTVVVKELVADGAKMEIDCVAVLP